MNSEHCHSRLQNGTISLYFDGQNAGLFYCTASLLEQQEAVVRQFDPQEAGCFPSCEIALSFCIVYDHDFPPEDPTHTLPDVVGSEDVMSSVAS